MEKYLFAADLKQLYQAEIHTDREAYVTYLSTITPMHTSWVWNNIANLHIMRPSTNSCIFKLWSQNTILNAIYMIKMLRSKEVF